jgi:nitrate reductase delta subunit
MMSESNIAESTMSESTETESNMDILNVLSCLIDYPREEVVASKDELNEVINSAKLEAPLKAKLLTFVEDHASKELLEWQSEYDALFERGRSLALWLFEHVHGESRDRGQAMVDLTAMYREAGLELSQHELPDYIPLFLEFLSTQGEENAQKWIQDMEHILGLLFCRLEKRNSDYAVLFETLLTIANSAVDLDDIRAQISGEKRDDTKEALDKEWEEEEVTFGADSLDKSCDSATNRPSESQRRDQDIPISWVDFDTSKQGAPLQSASISTEQPLSDTRG